MPKKTIFFAIFAVAVAAGLAGGLFFRAGENQKAPAIKTNAAKTLTENLPANKTAVIPFLYGEAAKKNKPLEKNRNEILPDDKNAASVANLTDSFTENFVADFFRRNSDGPININDKGTVSVLPQKDIETLIADAVSQWDDKKGASEIVIDDKNIILVADKTESQKEYSEKIRSALNKNFGEEMATALAQPQTVENMEKLFRIVTAAYDNIIREYQAIPVPYSLKNEHKIMLNSLVKQRDLWSAIKNYDEDPLGALIAIANFKIFDDEFSSAYQKITGEF